MAKFNVIIERDEDEMYTAEVIELPGCYTQAKTIPQLLERVKEAVQLYLESEEEPVSREKFISIKQIEVEA